MTRQQQRRMQRDMSRSKQLLNRKPLPVVEDERPRPAPRPLPERTEHPPIAEQHANWFKVYRLERRPSGIERVCIGEFRTLSGAIVHAENELYRAQVRDWQGFACHDTWRAEKPCD